MGRESRIYPMNDVLQTLALPRIFRLKERNKVEDEERGYVSREDVGVCFCSDYSLEDFVDELEVRPVWGWSGG